MIRAVIISLFLLFAGIHSEAQTKHALIVAIGNYPVSSGWPVISSGNDIGYMKNALMQQGFEAGNITVLKDSQATRAGIETALASLVNRVGNKDIVVVHFSCHGSQIQDDNGDEADGLDEAIVSYDAVYSGNPANYEKEQVNYFRDDSFGKYVHQLRKKLGSEGDLLVLINACHSGSGIRGNEKDRGSKPPLVSPGFNAASNRVANTVQLFQEPEENSNDLSTYIVYSAASAGERDVELVDEQQKGVGSLTYCFCKAIQQLPGYSSYRSLFARIQSVMLEKSLRQHPVMEGNGIDRSLFGGRFLEQQPYVEISKRVNNREFILSKGLLAGLDTGAVVAVYPAGTLNTQGLEPLAKGKVIAAGTYNSTIRLNSDPRLVNLAAGWVFITDPVFKLTPLAIRLENKSPVKGGPLPFTATEITTLKKEASNINILTEGNADLVWKRGKKSDSLFIESNGMLFSVKERTAGINTDWLRNALQDYSQFVFIRDLQLVDAKAAIDVKLIPFSNGEPDTVSINSVNKTGFTEVKEGDSAILWIRNSSKQSVFLNILDIQPNGIINPILPNRQSRVFPEDLKIRAGETLLLSKYVIHFSAPYGTEIFKVFTSRNEMDMEQLVNSHGNSVRGDITYMEKLVKKTFNQNVRGDNSTGTQEGSCSNIVFEIVPARKKK